MHRRALAHVRANVVAYVALFFALTGTAVAASGVVITSSRQIGKGVVNSGDIRDRSIRASTGQRARAA